MTNPASPNSKHQAPNHPANADTIVALSSASGESARHIVRLSGPNTFPLIATLAESLALSRRGATLTTLNFANVSVNAWVYTFPHPQSYTTEDTAEIHLPGNDLLARLLIDHLIDQGARQAEPGEFTARAYLNGRLDLTRAEGVQMTIAAQHAAELRAARQLMSGELAHRLRPLIDSVAETLALLEAGIDFSEEDISFIDTDALRSRIDSASAALHELADGAPRFEQLSRHPRFVLVGRPNAGKSTLLNALAGFERAVVSPVAGTTRDALSATVLLEGGLVEVIDVAGLESPGDRSDTPPEIAASMHARAQRAIEEADFVVHVIDASDNALPVTLGRDADLTVLNKIDLVAPPLAEYAVAVSARLGTNIDALRKRLNELAFAHLRSGAKLALNARHHVAIAEAVDALQRARESLAGGEAEVIAFDLRQSLNALGDVLGQVSPDDVIGRIFASFCIGK